MASPTWLDAGSTGETQLFMPQGEDAGTAIGDFVMATDGLNSAYLYYIEVPPDLDRLVVELFDPDIGEGWTAAEQHPGQRDRTRPDNSTFSSDFTYELRNPSGALVASLDGDDGGPSNGDWATLYDSTAGAPPTFIGQNTNSTPFGNSVTVTRPGPANVAGDLLLLVAVKDGSTALNSPNGGGWTQINEGPCSGDQCRVGVYRRYTTATEPGSHTITWGGGGEDAAVALLRYRGVHATVPIPAGGSGANTGSSASPTTPSVNASANSMVVRVYGADESNLSGTPYPAGHTGRLNFHSDTNNSGGEVSLGIADISPVAGPTTGTAAFALSAGEQWRAVTIALQPPVGAGITTAGHWELRVESTGGDDLNGLGIRAHDGDSGAGGTELPIYYDSHTQIGVNRNVAGDAEISKDYALYPWITSGCTFNHNDFDYDSNSANDPNPVGFVDYTSPSGAYSEAFNNTTLSENDEWNRDETDRWTTDNLSTDYGIWTMDAQIQTYIDGTNGNYANIYVGAFNVGANPPEQPEPNTFRVYLPTDDLDVPAKPYLEQLLTWEGGPNPPQVDQVTTVVNTVRLVNPTEQPITFSTPSRIVTATVPNIGELAYAGGSEVSQGTILTEPSIGSTGNITWNPGTLAAGATAILAYRIEVTPSFNGQRVVVTGTPNVSGTTAVYLDETANNSQTARTVNSLGPICELAVTVNTLTHAMVSRFEAVAVDGQMAIEWETSSEAGTLGFELYRRDRGRFKKVTDQMLPSLADGIRGAVYRYIDGDVSPQRSYEYLLAEIDRSGATRYFGPFVLEPNWEREVDEELGSEPWGFTSKARPIEPRMLERLALQRSERAARGLSRGLNGLSRPAASFSAGRGGAGGPRRVAQDNFSSTDALKVGVRNDGLYFVDAATIADALGTTEGDVQNAIGASYLRLTNRDQEIAWTPAAGNVGLYFYGQKIDSIFTWENVYRVAFGEGTQMQSFSVGRFGRGAGRPGPSTGGGAGRPSTGGVTRGGTAAPSSAPPVYAGGSFPSTIHFEQDLVPAVVLPVEDPTGYWFWKGMNPGTHSFALATPSPMAGEARLRARLQGATLSGAANTVTLRLNGVDIGGATWSGIEEQILDVLFDGSLLAASNELQVIVSLGAAFADWFEVEYQRAFESSGGDLFFTGGGQSQVTVGGLVDGEPFLLEMSDAENPKLLSGYSVTEDAGAFRAAFPPEGAANPYFVTSASTVRVPDSLRVDVASDLRSAGGAEWVVIAPSELVEAAGRLAAHRAGTGLSTMVVDLEDVMDEFNGGIQDPEAIRAFLRHAYLNWSVRPRFAVLAGDGSFDHRNVFNIGDNLLPPMMATTPSGVFAADSHFADVVGDDGIPEIAVGRIPVLSAGELDAYTEKLVAYEPSAPVGDTVLLVADNADGGADFPAQSDRLAQGLRGRAGTEALYLGDLPLPALRAQLFQRMRDGVAVVNYIGHGGVGQLADEGIMRPADVPGLGNGDRLPIIAGLTCALNRFEVPGFAGLGEELTLQGDGGGLAVWAPSGLSLHAEAETLGAAFFRFFEPDVPTRVGDAIVAALTDYAGAGAVKSMLDIYALLGDPAVSLTIHAPEEPEPPGGGGGGGGGAPGVE